MSRAAGAPKVVYDPRNPVFFVPFRPKGQQVVGRSEALKAVRQQLETGHRTAIGQTASFAGLGGLGKTQLAVEYAYSYRESYANGVIWLSADQDIDGQLIEIGGRAGWFPLESEHKDKLAIAIQRLRNFSQTLIVFDNLQALSAIEDYLPEPQAEPHILVTSRAEHATFVPVPLELLDSQSSLQLIIQEAGRSPASEPESLAAVEIAQRLGGLPLALELAGAYLRHRPITWERYRDLLRDNMKAALPAKFLGSSFTKHEADLYSTLKINSEIFAEEPALKEILDVLTWSGLGSMGISLLSELVGTTPTKLTNALGIGKALRLLQQVPGSESYSIHQLVSDVRREDVPLDAGWAAVTAGRLVVWFQKHKRDFADLSKFESEIEHLNAWLSNVGLSSRKLASRLVWLRAYPPFHRGRFKDSLSLLLEAKDLLGKSTEEDLELEGNLQTDLCTIYTNLGEYAKGKECGHRALDIRLRLLGEKHVDTAMSLNNLGAAYRSSGDSRRALEYTEQALKIWQELQGEKHIDTALALDNMCSQYRVAGDRQKALEFALKALAVREEVLGTSHPDTAHSFSQLATVYAESGQFDEALSFQDQALSLTEDLFGKSSALRALVLRNAASVYFLMGKFRLALERSQEALEIRRELFGDLHPDCVRLAVDCSFLFCRLGQIHKGYEMLDEWLKKLPIAHVLYSDVKKQRLGMQQQYPRPGFRQAKRLK